MTAEELPIYTVALATSEKHPLFTTDDGPLVVPSWTVLR